MRALSSYRPRFLDCRKQGFGAFSAGLKLLDQSVILSASQHAEAKHFSLQFHRLIIGFFGLNAGVLDLVSGSLQQIL